MEITENLNIFSLINLFGDFLFILNDNNTNKLSSVKIWTLPIVFVFLKKKCR
jgi:hypothetical protein